MYKMRLCCILLCLFDQSYSATLKSPSAKSRDNISRNSGFDIDVKLELKFDGYFSDLAIFTAIRFQNTQCNSGNDNVSDKKVQTLWEGNKIWIKSHTFLTLLVAFSEYPNFNRGLLISEIILHFQNGTCYTKRECEKRSGVSDGLCAEGYGVCCICKKQN